MYDVPPVHWVKVSHMHFKGPATRWIESLEQPNRLPWPDLCTLLHKHFGRNQRDKLSSQMFHIQQTSTVTDYVERFATLFDQLKAYQPILTSTTIPLASWMGYGMIFKSSLLCNVLLHWILRVPWLYYRRRWLNQCGSRSSTG
jgi:hypothetical protein